MAAVRACIADAAFMDAPCVIPLYLGCLSGFCRSRRQIGMAYNLLGSRLAHDGDDEAHVA